MTFSKTNFLLSIFILLSLTALGRLIHISFFMDSLGRDRFYPRGRGTVYSQDGWAIALSRERYNLYIDNRKETEDFPVEDVSRWTKVPIKKLKQALSNQNIFLLKRYLDHKNAERLRGAKDDRFLLERVYERTHPHPYTMSHSLGFVNSDGKGLTGIERQYEQLLAASDRSLPERHLVTSIHYELQRFVEIELKKTIQKHAAENGMVLIQDIATGSLRVMTYFPNYHLEKYERQIYQGFFNHLVSGIIEPGSIMKIFFLAYCMENRLDASSQVFECPGSLTLINDEVIRCPREHGKVTFKEIMRYSCNVGAILATASLTRRQMHDFLRQCHFGEKTEIDLPLEHPGLLHPPNQWGLRTTATIPIGHGIGVTPIQLISSFSALLNGGFYAIPHLGRAVVDWTGEELRTNLLPLRHKLPVLSPQTSRHVVELLAFGTDPHSTGKLASQSPFISIGKTGTSQRINRRTGRYFTNQYNSLFIGAYPPDAPEISILIIIGNPQREYHGGKVAAPLFARLLPRTITTLDIGKGNDKQTVENRWIGGNTPVYIVDGRMPDMANRSLREILIMTRAIKKHCMARGQEMQVHLEGSGYVIDQTPPSDAPLIDHHVIRLKLSPNP